MTENDDSLIDNIKTQLYELYIDIKTSLVSSEKEREKHENLKEISSTTDAYTIIKYIKKCIKIIIEDKKNNELKNITNNNNIDNNNDIIQQFESYIKKLEKDLKYSIKKQFMFKIQKDSLEMKIKGYMELEEEYEQLKEKVRYEGGKFLDNDRKDNEIIILRRENSNLKSEINKIDEKSKNYEKKYNGAQDIINGLKFKVSQLNKKIEDLNEELKDLKNKNKIIINENNNEIFSITKNIVEHYNKNIEKNTLDKINISNINNIGNNKINLHLKRDLTNYQLPLNNCNNFESTKINPIKALNTIDSSNKFVISNFSKIYNNKNLIAPFRNNKFNNTKNKSNSVCKKSEENEKKSELFNKYLSGNTNNKNDITHHKIRSLNKLNKNIQGNTYKLPLARNNFNIRNIQKEDRNLYEHSALNIIGFNKIKI